MGTAIRTRLIKIGNSRGIRLPRALIEQAGLEQDVEVEAREGQLIVRVPLHLRAGWDEEFRAMSEQGDDLLLDAEAASLTQWDETEWQW